MKTEKTTIDGGGRATETPNQDDALADHRRTLEDFMRQMEFRARLQRLNAPGAMVAAAHLGLSLDASMQQSIAESGVQFDDLAKAIRALLATSSPPPPPPSQVPAIVETHIGAAVLSEVVAVQLYRHPAAEPRDRQICRVYFRSGAEVDTETTDPRRHLEALIKAMRACHPSGPAVFISTEAHPARLP